MIFLISCFLLIGTSFAEDTNDTNIIENKEIIQEATINEINYEENKENSNLINENYSDSDNDLEIEETNEENKNDIVYDNNEYTSNEITKGTSSYNYYVNPTTGSDNNQGSASSPFQSINKAVTVASSGQSIYLYNGNHSLSNNISISKTLTFTGQNKNNVIINGLNNHTAFTINSGTFTISNVKFIKCKGSYGSAFKVKSNAKLIVNNCIFQSNTGANGGVIGSVEDGSQITLTNSAFTSNTASNFGGTIFIAGENSKLTITKCTFTNNKSSKSEGKGGAIYLGGFSNSTISGTFTGNTARYGGAIYTASSSTSIVKDSTFTNNKALCNSVYALGGAINFAAGDHNVSNITCTNNTANRGGAISINSGRPVIITKSVFNKNHALDEGGAIFNYGGGSVNYCNFTQNKAQNRGGAIYDQSTSIQYTITNCRFISNNAYSTNTSEGIAGAVALCAQYGRYYITKCVFNTNNGNNGGAIAIIPTTVSCDVINSSFNKNNANEKGVHFITKEKIQT